MSELLTTEAIKYLQENGFGHFVGIAVVIIVFLIAITSGITWYITHKGTLAGLRIQDSDVRLKDGEVLKEISSSRQTLSGAVDTQNLHLREFLSVLREMDSEKVAVQREELCRFHSREYSDALEAYLECCLVYSIKKDFEDRVLLDFLPALQSKVKILEAINSASALEKSNNSTAFLLKATPCKIFIRKISRQLPVFAVATKWKLRRVGCDLAKHFRENT